jgi:hypothetical protein
MKLFLMMDAALIDLCDVSGVKYMQRLLLVMVSDALLFCLFNCN